MDPFTKYSLLPTMPLFSTNNEFLLGLREHELFVKEIWEGPDEYRQTGPVA